MKFISSSYDPESGISAVTMQHMGVKFTGTAKLNPVEKEKGSKYAGCSYAEMRATILALKYERKIAKKEADACLNFVKSLECYSKFNKEEDSAKSVYRLLNKRIKRVNDITDEINFTMHQLQAAIKNREIVTKAIERKKKIDNDKVD